jgi:sulfatase maturation enzyme AslB (radical SAM superfamily)
MNTKLNLPFLEVMVLRSCNLSCKGCTTFSDLKHQGDYGEWSQTKEWLEQWNQRLNIEAIGFMGGEPLIHPNIKDWIIGARQILPTSQIRFVTNGLLLEKSLEIIDTLYELGNSVLKISVHIEDARINRMIKYIMNRFDWKPVTEFHINRWSTGNDFKFQINRPERFYQTFKGTYSDMKPHDNNPADAFHQLCVQKKCPLLFEGKLYKCGTAGLTPHILKKFNNPNIELWEPYMNTGLTLDCTNEELNKFINNFGKPHSMCRQCPVESDRESVIDHSSNVSYK